MRVFRYALTVCARHPIYLVIYVGFLSLMGLFMAGGLTFGAESDDFAATEVPFTVVDRDGGAIAAGLAEFLDGQGEAVEVPDEARALQDAAATGRTNYLLVIPGGFGDAFMESARAGEEAPVLECVFSFESMQAMLVDTQVTQYLGLLRAAAALAPDADQDAVVARADAAAAAKAPVEVARAPEAAVGADRFVFYLMWSAYPLTAAIVVSVGIIMGAFNRTDVRRRVLVSAESGLGLGVQKALAGVVVTVGVWAVIMAVGLAAFADAAACLPAPTVALALFAELLFALTPLALGFLLGQLGVSETASNSVGNIVGIVFTFFGGAWVSLSLLPEAVRVVAAFSPVYWLTEALNACVVAGSDSAAALADALPCLGVLVLFAAALFATALVAGRLRAQSGQAGGNAAAASPR